MSTTQWVYVWHAGENKWHHGVQTSRPGESTFFMASKFAEIWMYSLADIFTMLTTSKPMSQMEMQLMMPNVAWALKRGVIPIEKCTMPMTAQLEFSIDLAGRTAEMLKA